VPSPDNTYVIGQAVELEFDLTVAGAPTSDTVVVTVTPPSGTPITPTVTQSPTGVFKATVVANQAGLWWYSATGTANVAIGRGSFVVESLMPVIRTDALTDLLSAREFVLEDATDDSQDFRLDRLINAYSRAIYKYTRREWRPQSSSVRSFSYDGSGVLELANPDSDARAVTAVTLYTDLPTASQQILTAPSTSIEGDWRLGPIGGTPEGTYLRIDFTSLLQRPFNVGGFPGYGNSQYFQQRIDYKVNVTGTWGICATLADVPEEVQLACLIAVADAYRNPEGFASRLIGPLQLTEETPTSPSSEFAPRDLPPEARSLLDPYRARSISFA
jgi:hypothetical protein